MMRQLVGIKRIVKNRLGEFWWYSLVIFCVQRIGDLINMYIGLWLVPKFVPMEQLGALLPLTQVAGLLGLPLAVILTPLTKFINVFSGRHELGKVKAMLADGFLVICLSSILVGAYTWSSAPFFFARLRIDSRLLVWILVGITVTSLITPLLNGVLSGLKKFRVMTLIGLVSPPVRLGVLFVLLPINGFLGYFSSQLALNLFTCLISLWGIRYIISRSTASQSYYEHSKEMVIYTMPFVLIIALGTVSSAVQAVIIRQRLPEVESAAYYFTTRLAEMTNLLWGSINLVFFPFVSSVHERGQATMSIFLKALGVSSLCGLVLAVCLGLLGPWLFSHVPAWDRYVPYAHLVGWLAVTNVFRNGFACVSSYEMACRRFGFLGYYVGLTILETVFLISFTGYSFFIPYLPSGWIEWMASLRVARLEFIVRVFFLTTGVMLASSLIHVLFRKDRPKTRAAQPRLCS